MVPLNLTSGACTAQEAIGIPLAQSALSQAFQPLDELLVVIAVEIIPAEEAMQRVQDKAVDLLLEHDVVSQFHQVLGGAGHGPAGPGLHPITLGGTPAREGRRVPEIALQVRKVGGLRTASSCRQQATVS